MSSDGTQATGWSMRNAVSADGRYVAFASASDLAPGGTGCGGVFVRDLETGQTTRADINEPGSCGGGAPAISADGRYVAFESYSNGRADIFLHDRQTGQTERVSQDGTGQQANGVSMEPSISADGGYVAFTSYASNLVEGDTNGRGDAFVYDHQAGQITIASVDSAGVEGNGQSWATDISADGRYIVFTSDASNLVLGDSNGASDVFLHDRVYSPTTLVSVGSAGQGDNGSDGGTISADGRRVAFRSSASNLVSDDTNSSWDVFVRDLQTEQTARVSVNSAGSQANDSSWNAEISGDGRFVAFDSRASNLVSGDTNLCSDPTHNCRDIFVRDLETGKATRASVDSAGSQANGESEVPAISPDGRYVAFTSYASNLVPADTNGTEDVFLIDRAPPPVGGIAEPPSLDAKYAHGVGPSRTDSALAGVAGATLLLAAGWYAMRRWRVG